MVARVCIRLPYIDLVNEMHLENWAGIGGIPISAARVSVGGVLN